MSEKQKNIISSILAASLVVLALIAFLLAAAHFADAHDPFTGLHNANGTSCCSSEGPTSDCKETTVRYGPNDQLQALIDERWQQFGGGASFVPLWVDIPKEKVLPIEKNPLAGDVVCYLPHLGVICYLPGRGT